MKRQTNRERTSEFALVKRALELGWKPDKRNQTARRHFYFYRHGSREVVSVSWWIDSGNASYTVGDTTTSYEPQALELLEYLAERVDG